MYKKHIVFHFGLNNKIYDQCTHLRYLNLTVHIWHIKNINCYLASGQQPDGIDQPDEITTEITTVTETTTDVTTASNGNRNLPSGWTGPSAVLYQSFDSSDGLFLKEGTQTASNPVPLVSGKVRYISFFQENKQHEIKSKCEL